MRIEHTSNYEKVIKAAKAAGARSVSFQHHVFVNFDERSGAEAFHRKMSAGGFKPWDINTNRGSLRGVPYEVIVQRW